MRTWRCGGRSSVPALMMLSLAACAVSTPAGQDRTTPEPVGRAWLDRYEAAFGSAASARPLVQVGPWSRVAGHGTDAQKTAVTQALAVGDVQRAARLPGVPTDLGTATWADGTATVVTLLSAAEAVQAAVVEGRLTASGPALSGARRPIRVVNARLTSMTVGSTHGAVRVPAWRLSLQSSAFVVLRPAVTAQPNVTLPAPTNVENLPALYADSGELDADGRTLTAAFTGSPRRQDEECGADYTGRAIQSPHAVVVLLTEHPHVGGTAKGCDSAGARRTATVRLDQPMGDRALLGGLYGDAVPVIRGDG
jgi:hypothetical protein